MNLFKSTLICIISLITSFVYSQNKRYRIEIPANLTVMGSDTQKLYLSGNILSIGGQNSVTLPSGGGTVYSVGATAPAEGLTISNSPITSTGSLVFALANDLLGLENLSTLGFAVRTAANTWTTRSFIAGPNITLSNTNGVSGDITIGVTGIASYTAGPGISIASNVITNTSPNINQSLAFTGSTSFGVTLSNGGGGFNILAGANVSLSHDGLGNLTINATGSGGGSLSGSGTINQHAKFVGSTTIGNSIVSDNGSDLFIGGSGNNFVFLGTGVTTANRIYFGSGTSTFVGEELQDNRLTLSGDMIGFKIAGSFGANGQVLVSNGATVSWTTLSSGTSGSGTTNFIPLWTSSNTLGNSTIQQNSTLIGMSGASPVAGILTQWPSGDIRIGTTAGTTNRILFGDGSFVYVGEESTDDRLVLKASTLMINMLSGGGTGSSGQVLTSNGTTASWQTPAGASATNLSWSGITSTSATISNSNGTGVTLLASGGTTFSNSGGSLQISSSSGGSGTVTGISTSGSLITSAIGGTGSVQYVAGAGMTITNSGTSTNAILNFSSSGGTTYTAGPGISIVSGVISNTGDLNSTNEIQTISLASNTLSLSLGGGSVSLAPYINTDAQTLSLASNTLSISGGNSVSLTPYVYTAGPGISIVSNVITNTSLNTDAQTLSLAGSNLSISGGNTISLSSFANTDNQLLTYSASGNVLTISGGNTVNMFGSYLTPTVSGSSDYFLDINASCTRINVIPGYGGSIRTPSAVNGKVMYVILSGADATLIGVCEGPGTLLSGRLYTFVSYGGCWFCSAP